uniref:Putative pol-like protein n=1 Tax=Ixodes ricinus TaxID=34613 RepID=A0A0K8R4W7_IXORI
MSIDRRRFSLRFMYSLRIRSVAQHPAREVVEGTKDQRTFENKPSIIPPFTIRNWNLTESVGIDSKLPVAIVAKMVAPWNFNCIRCDFSLTKFNKKDTPTEVMRQ